MNKFNPYMNTNNTTCDIYVVTLYIAKLLAHMCLTSRHTTGYKAIAVSHNYMFNCDLILSDAVLH